MNYPKTTPPSDSLPPLSPRVSRPAGIQVGTTSERLSEEGVDILNNGRCPNCMRGSTLRLGPQEGMSQDIICSDCGARYDATRFRVGVPAPALSTKPLSMWGTW